jgi:hypothetical protein
MQDSKSLEAKVSYHDLFADPMTQETFDRVIDILKNKRYIVLTDVPEIDDLKNRFLPMVRRNKDLDVEKYGIGQGTTGP